MIERPERISLGKHVADSPVAPTIRVEIYDQIYNIRSEDDGEYIKLLANYVDKQMREISSGTLTVDSLKVAILAAIHIADELHRTRSLQAQADEQLVSRSAECADLLDRLLKTRNPNESDPRPEGKSVH